MLGSHPKLERIFIMMVLRILFVFSLLSLLSVSVFAQDIHGPMTRYDFEHRNPDNFAKVVGHPDDWAKGLSPDKDGALGDAAATSDRYDVLRYELDLRIDPELRSINGSVKMVFSAVVPFQEFVFDLTEQLFIDNISHSSGDLFFTHDVDSVSVTLDAAMTVGQTDSLTIHYRGYPQEPTFRRGLMFLLHDSAPNDDPEDGGPIVASMSEPAYAQHWWPCKDRPDDKALSQVSLTVPDHLIGVSNGNLMAETAADAGWKTYLWQENYPIATYLISVAISNYVYLESPCVTPGGTDVPLKNWVFRPDSTAAVVEFAPLCEMMGFCEDFFGPYPFQGEKYGHAEFIWFGAMEHQTVTSIGSSSIAGDGSNDWLIVHELGHQWFGDSLTPHNWADIWLNEGFATYAESLWREHLGGMDAYHQDLADGREEAFWEQQGPVYDPVPVFPGKVIYDKGAWILHMLRGRMGDASFFAMLEDWANGGGRPGATVTTEQFIAHAESYYGSDLGGFFDPYLNSTTLPQMGYEFEITDGPNGTNTHLELVLKQYQTPFFDNIFPVAISHSSGTTTVNMHITEFQATLSYDLLAGEITGVAIDPEHWVLWQPVGGTSTQAGLTDIYPNPSQGAYVYLRYRLDDNSSVILRVYNAMGAEVSYRDYGRKDPEGTYNEIVWDVKDNSGVRVPSGVYWAALEINGQRSVRKFSVIR
jgi:aminopeptidase N